MMVSQISRVLGVALICAAAICRDSYADEPKLVRVNLKAKKPPVLSTIVGEVVEETPLKITVLDLKTEKTVQFKVADVQVLALNIANPRDVDTAVALLKPWRYLAWRIRRLDGMITRITVLPLVSNKAGKVTPAGNTLAKNWSAVLANQGGFTVFANQVANQQIAELNLANGVNSKARQVIADRFPKRVEAVLVGSLQQNGRVGTANVSLVEIKTQKVLFGLPLKIRGLAVTETNPAGKVIKKTSVKTVGKKIKPGQLKSPGGVLALAVDPLGQFLLSAGSDRKVTIWDLKTGLPSRESFPQPAADVRSLDVFRVGNRGVFAISTGKKQPIVWNLTNPRERKFLNLNGHTEGAFLARYSPHRKRIMSVSWDETIRLWTLDRDPNAVHTAYPVSAELAGDVDFSPDGKRLLFGCYGNALRIWDIDAGGEVALIPTGHERLNSLRYSTDNVHALAADAKGTVSFWDLEQEEQQWSYGKQGKDFPLGHSQAVTCLAVSPDSLLGLSGSEDGSVVVWDLMAGQPLHRFEGHNGSVNAVTFSPDGRFAISGGKDGIQIWSTETGK